MTQEQQNLAMAEIMESEPVIQPSDIELIEMFEAFIQGQEEEIPTLPRGFGQ